MTDDKLLIEQTAKRLRKARRDRHLTQVEVAGKAGISQTYYAQVERAKRNPSTSIFIKIIYAINVASKEIIGK